MQKKPDFERKIWGITDQEPWQIPWFPDQSDHVLGICTYALCLFGRIQQTVDGTFQTEICIWAENICCHIILNMSRDFKLQLIEQKF